MLRRFSLLFVVLLLVTAALSCDSSESDAPGDTVDSTDSVESESDAPTDSPGPGIAAVPPTDDVCAFVPIDALSRKVATQKTYRIDADVERVDTVLRSIKAKYSGLRKHRVRSSLVELENFDDALRIAAVLREREEIRMSRSQAAACGQSACTPSISSVPKSLDPIPEWFSSMDDLDILGDLEKLISREGFQWDRCIRSVDSYRVAVDTCHAMREFDTEGRFVPEYIRLPGLPQPSFLAKLPGRANGESSLLFGAHLDAVCLPDDKSSPGVEDNLSGVVMQLAMMNAIVDLNLSFEPDLYFAFYASEEFDFEGSCSIRTAFEGDGRIDTLNGVFNFDMVGRELTGSNEMIYLAEGSGGPWVALDVKEVFEKFLGDQFVAEGYSGTPQSDNITWQQACVPVASFKRLPPGEGPISWYHTMLDTETDLSAIEKLVRAMMAVLAEMADPVVEESSVG